MADEKLTAECEEVDVVFSVRVRNEQGQTVAVQTSAPVKLLRAITPDIWAFIDQQIARNQQ